MSDALPVEMPAYLGTETHCPAENRSRANVAKHLQQLEQFPGSIEPYPVEAVDNPFDLKNLRYTKPTADGKRLLTAETVTNLLAKINNEQFIQEVLKGNKLFVIGIGTGGTISMVPNDQGKLVPDKDFINIVRQADPSLLDRYQIASLDAYAIDSSEMTIGDEGDLVISMCHLWQNMDPRLKKFFAGFLVIHGTDTMPRSGAHMLAMLGKYMPFNVVHTGAQKPIGIVNNDARVNVPDSLYQLEAQYHNGICDATTVMGRTANLTAGITKVSDYHAEAMDAYMHKEVLDLASGADPRTVKLPDWLRRKPPAHGAPFHPVVYRGPNRVGEEWAEMEQNPAKIITAIRYDAWLALLATTYGAGTFDPPIAKLIGSEAKRQNLPLFAVSPVNADPELEVYDAASELIKAGAIPLYMTREMARAKIMRWMALFFQQDGTSGSTSGVPFSQRMGVARTRLEEYMADQLVGEIPTAQSKRILKPEQRIGVSVHIGEN